MIEYLLDTNICIALMVDDPHVRDSLRGIDRGRIGVSAVVLFELWFGAEKSSMKTKSVARFERFCADFPNVLVWDKADAMAAGTIRWMLEAQGQMIGPYDTLIAGQAVARGLTLVTANEREFARVKGLKWENWAKPVLRAR